MRTLTPAQLAAIALPITRPLYVARLQLTATYYLSSRGDVDFEPYPAPVLGWEGGILDGVEIGENSARITLRNDDNWASALVLGEAVQDKPIDIWQLYGDSSPFVDGVLLFRGVMDAVSAITPLAVVIDCVSLYGSQRWSPPITCSAPLMNHMPEAGQRLGDIILEPANYA